MPGFFFFFPDFGQFVAVWIFVCLWNILGRLVSSSYRIAKTVVVKI